MNVNLQQCQFVKTRVRLVKYTCIFVETPQSSRSIYKGDFIRGVTTIRGNKRIVRACYTVQRFCNLQQRARVYTPRSKLLFRSLCTLVFMFNLPVKLSSGQTDSQVDASQHTFAAKPELAYGLALGGQTIKLRPNNAGKLLLSIYG